MVRPDARYCARPDFAAAARGVLSRSPQRFLTQGRASRRRLCDGDILVELSEVARTSRPAGSFE